MPTTTNRKTLRTEAQVVTAIPALNPTAQPWAFVAIIILTLASYSYLFYSHAGFIWDDPDYVVNNQNLRTLRGLFDTWFHPTTLPQYYPLVHTTYWIEYHLWGLEPLGYHAVNVALHTISALLLWRLLKRLEVSGAWFAAAIFAVHPVMVESVAWVTERKNVLSMVFYLLSMGVYLKGVGFRVSGVGEETTEPPKPYTLNPKPYTLAFVLFLAALFSKTVTASLPAAILLILWWKRGRLRWRDVLPLIPFFIIGIAMSQYTAWLEVHHVGADGTHVAELRLGALQRVLIAGRAIWFYASTLVWPTNLSFIYPRWEPIDSHILWQWLFPIGVVIVVAMLILLTWLRGISRGVLTAVLFFCGTLFPALGFVNVYPMRFSFVADHFQYHASIGLVTLGAALLCRAMRLLKPTAQPWAWRSFVVCIIAALGYLTWSRTHAYVNAETLWRDTLKKNDTGWMVYVNLGKVLADKDQVDEAQQLYEKALELRPDLHDTHTLVAMMLGMRAQKEQEKPHPDPQAVRTFNNEAIAELNKALDIKEDFAPAHYTLGQIYSHQAKINDAIRELSRAIEIAPDYAKPHFELAKLLEMRGDLSNAIYHYERAVVSEPEWFEARYNLGTACLAARRYDQAAAELSEATRIKPDAAEAWTNLGAAQLHLGMRGAAIDSYKRALRINPNLPQARRSLDVLLRG
jgi:Tfp pilus assembly protein PilF